MNIQSKILASPINKFIIYFVALVAVFITLNNIFLSEFYTNFVIKSGNNYFKENINKDYHLNREVKIENANDNSNEIILSTIFLDKTNPDGTYQAKNIRINVIYEGLLPILFVLVLTISLPVHWKRKLVSSITAFVLMNLYIYFKLYAFAYDNYSSPDFLLKELPFLTGFFVYWYNYFISISGYSFNLVMSVIIFAVSSIRLKDLESVNEIFQNKIN